MKQKVNQILEKDYERYTVHLPWSILIKGKANKYIYSELEKKHPCFSDEWYYEKKLAIKKSGIDSDVVVMNKFVLAEYKNRFPGKKLWLEKSSGRSFASKNKVYEVFLVSLCLIFIAGSVAISFTVKEKKNLTVEEKPILVKTPIRNESVKNFLDFIEKNNGRFSSLKWTSDGYSECFTVDLQGIYPEQLDAKNFMDNCQIGNVLYKNSKPYMTVTLKDNYEENNLTVQQDAFTLLPEKENVNRILIRQIFNNYKIAMQEEKYKKLEFRFTCPVYFEIEGENFFEAINNLAKKMGFGISNLELTRIENNGGNDGYSGVLVFEDRIPYQKGINLEPLAWRTNLIIEKNKKLKAEFMPAENLITANSKNQKNILLGEILKDDGSKIRFYKNEEGKVIKEVLGYE